MKKLTYILILTSIVLSCNKQVEEKIGTVSYLDCENIVYDSVNQIITIPFSGGNGGNYAAQTLNSTGITGLTATLKSGSFSDSKTLDDLTRTLQGNDDVNGFLTFKVSGTPSSKKGTAYFDLSIGGQYCSFSIPIGSNNQGGGTNTQGKIGPNVTDIDGNTYKTVYIGTQQWMAENLKVSKYNDGTTIPNVTDKTQWSNLTTGAWCYYDNDVANNSKFGKLYNWYTVSTITNDNKNLCPVGWHVPTDSEWTVLTDYLGGESVAGAKMKEVGTTNWKSPNTDATNTSLFTGLPGGYRLDNGNYYEVGTFCYWWSSTENNTSFAWSRYLYKYDGNAPRDNLGKKNAFSVRCLRD